MSKTPWSDQQRRAIETRDVSVALSAGAGCGKTFVLTERFLAHLDPADPHSEAPLKLDELVAITFTDRAAREMRDRIRAKCYERLESAPPDQAAYWQTLLRTLDAARVSTIHSFCATLLRSHAVEARLDPRFGLLDESQKQALLSETIDGCLREGLGCEDDLTMEVARRFGLGLLQTSAWGLMSARQNSSFGQWMNMTPAEQVERWKRFHREKYLPAVLEGLAASRPARRMIAALQAAEVSHAKMRERQATILALLPDLPKAKNPAEAVDELIEAARVQSGGGKGAWDSEELYEQFKDSAKVFRERASKLKPLLAFDSAGALEAAEAGLKLLQWASQVGEAYDRRKAELNVLDFDDLLIHAHKLLTSPDHRETQTALAEGIRMLLVDEFQDTDPLQVELIQALCGDAFHAGRLFFVGDFKQSIYRFRGADPRVFRELQQATPTAGQLTLSANYRSQPAILRFVNFVFADVFGEEYEPLSDTRPQVAPEPAIEFLWTESEEPPRTAGAAERARRAEADQIARRLAELLSDGLPRVQDKEAAAAGVPPARAAKLGDVAILFRALTDVAYYEEALRNHGLDYYLVGGHAFYAQQEIFDLLNLLRAVAIPADQISLAGVLRSPFFSLADETLYWLAQHEDGLAGGLFAAKPPRELDEQQRQQTAFAAQTLAELRAMKDNGPIADLVAHALARTGYDAILLAEFLGERKLANLQKLINQARAFDVSGRFGLADFIVQLSQFVANQPREALAATQGESTDVIRLMTIHQAKGLEFPIVVVPDLDRKEGGRVDRVEFSAELGPVVSLQSDEAAKACTGHDLFKAMHTLEENAEAYRLFYVASTRAADYLILSSSRFRDKNPVSLSMQWIDDVCGLDGRKARELPIRVTLHEAKRTSGKRTRPRSANLAAICDQAEQPPESPTAARSVPPSVEPIAVDHAARRLFSFSRLTGRLARPAELPPTEANLADIPAVDPRGLGSLVHAALEWIDFANPSDIEKMIERLAEDAPLAISLVKSFLQGEVARSLAAAQTTHRELEFLLAWPPEGAQGAASEEAILHGYIDCLYQDAAGRWVLLDYKTNNVTASQAAAAAQAYELQLFVYATAVERATGHWPDEAALTFLRPGVYHRFAWSDADRRRLQAAVDEAIHVARTGP